MTTPTATNDATTVGEFLGQRLKELERTEEELAEAARVPPEYISDLVAGRRRPPLPGRTDVYGLMNSFLKLGRNELVDRAQSERDATEPAKPALPKPKVRRLLMDLCEPETAAELERRRAKSGNTELIDYFQRLLQLTQSAVARVLSDQATLRIAAERSGRAYADARLSVLEFLDSTPDTLTPKDVVTFFHPRISKWDVDPETGVLRVVMQAQDHPSARRWTNR